MSLLRKILTVVLAFSTINHGVVVHASPFSFNGYQTLWNLDSNTRGTPPGEAVKEAFRHSWNGYKQYAWGYDELLAVSKRGGNSR